MSQRKILITGMSGLIGTIAREHLEGRYQLSALNRRPVQGVQCYRADIADLDAIQSAFEGVDVVVHLAALAESDASWEQLLHHNLIGTYNVFEASRQAGVKRVIYASSGATVSNWERVMPYRALVEGSYQEVKSWQKLTHKSPTRPTDLYGCSKVWGEALARHFSDTYGISTICLRIGHVNREDRPTAIRQFSVWCSHRDIAQMIEKCIEAPARLTFDIFFAVSNNKWSYRDVEHAREVVGFEPQDGAEKYRDSEA